MNEYGFYEIFRLTIHPMFADSYSYVSSVVNATGDLTLFRRHISCIFPANVSKDRQNVEVVLLRNSILV
jgi:hypothetical protein